jgi:hypothetical protein
MQHYKYEMVQMTGATGLITVYPHPPNYTADNILTFQDYLEDRLSTDWELFQMSVDNGTYHMIFKPNAI